MSWSKRRCVHSTTELRFATMNSPLPLCESHLTIFFFPSRLLSECSKVMIDRIMRCEYMRMNGGVWDEVSDKAKAFVASLLQMDPDARPSAAKALKSPWMQAVPALSDDTMSGKAPDSPLHRDTERARQQEQWKRHAVLLVEQQLSSDEIFKLREAFVKYDKEGTGHVNFADFQKALAESGKWSKEDLESKFANVVRVMCLIALMLP